MMHAKKAKNKTAKNKNNFSYHLDLIERDIEEAIARGENRIYHNLHDEDQLLYDSLSSVLLAHGYYSSWNRACLWMEISWS